MSVLLNGVLANSQRVPQLNGAVTGAGHDLSGGGIEVFIVDQERGKERREGEERRKSKEKKRETRKQEG